MINKIIPDTSSPFLSSVAADTAALAFTEIKWPNNPFHMGEIALQQAAGVQEHVMSYAPQFVRHYLPEQHRQFYPELPFLVVAARDETGAMWSTLLEKTAPSNTNNDDKNDAKFITSPDDKTMRIQAQPVPGDALHNAFSPHTQTDLGILGIQLETKRRNRVNGRAVADANGGLVFTVDQSFGNCPQYIKPRVNWYKAAATSTNSAPSTKSKLPFAAKKKLTTHQIQWIQSAETVFTASGYRGTGEDVRFGNDASHRGGSPGFMSVDVGNHKKGSQQQHVISWTEYPGNNHFNTLGNILMDPRVGISIPNFETGGLLQVSGTATVEMGKLEDGGRKVHLYVAAVNELPAGSLPIRWPTFENVQEGKIQVMVSKIVQESETVKSFYLEPADPFQTLKSFRAGQHLPIELALEDGEVVKRTYSLSAAPHSAKAGFYRISVKHEPNGKASSFLHNRVRVGDTLTVGEPAGDFFRQKTEEKAPSSSTTTTTTVLLSSGIGVTPLLSMLHEVVAEKSNNNSSQQVVWMHGARNRHHHAFMAEVDSLLQKHNNNNNHSKQPSILQSRIFYSQPNPGTDNDNHGDQYPHNNITTGRMSAEAVRQQLVPLLHTDKEEWKKAVFYMCGPPSFLADLESGLEALGVAPTNIHYETF